MTMAAPKKPNPSPTAPKKPSPPPAAPASPPGGAPPGAAPAGAAAAATLAGPPGERQAGQMPTVPPEETIWQKYSPNQEFPISTVMSFVLHACAGLLLAVAFRSPQS